MYPDDDPWPPNPREMARKKLDKMREVKHSALLKVRPGIDVDMIGRERSKFGQVVDAYLDKL